VEEHDLLDAEAVARILGVSTMTIYRLAQSGDLPSIRVSANIIRFESQDVLNFLRRHYSAQNGVDRWSSIANVGLVRSAVLADRLRISRATLHRLLRAKAMPAIRFGRVVLIDEADVDTYLVSRRNIGSQETVR